MILAAGDPGVPVHDGGDRPANILASPPVVTEGVVAEIWTSETPDRPGKVDEDGGIWIDSWLAGEAPFSFVLDGRSSRQFLPEWPLVREEVERGDACSTQALTWTDPVSGLRVTWRIKTFDGFPAVDWVLTFKNTGSKNTPIVENILALDLRLNHSGPPQDAYTLHGAAGGRSKRDDFIPFSRPLLPGHTLAWWADRASFCGEITSSEHVLPFFNVETPDARGLMLGIGWSGNWRAGFHVEGTTLAACAEMRDAHFTLRPGEEIRSVRTLAMVWQGQRLHGHNLFRRLLRGHYVPPFRGREVEPRVSTHTCLPFKDPGRILRHGSEQDILPLVEPWIDLGVELFVIDTDYWEGEPTDQYYGDWRISKTKFPRGFRPISDPLAAAGADFAVWFPSEAVATGAPIYKEHPEFCIPRKTQRWMCHAPHGCTLRMELPEAREWFLSRVDRMIENEGMTCFRQDSGPEYQEGADDRRGVHEAHHTAGFYAMLDEMRRRHPDLAMDGCAGGGRRIDLETVTRFHWNQKSDRWFDCESDQCGLYGANLFLPGGWIMLFSERLDDYGAWSAFAGMPSLAWPLLDGEFNVEQARLQIGRYKRFRRFLHGDFYPLTPCSLNAPWIGYQFHLDEENEGGALLFRRLAAEQAGHPVSETFTARLRGLAPEFSYLVRFEASGREACVSGRDLHAGLSVTIRDAPGAEMIVYRLSDANR